MPVKTPPKITHTPEEAWLAGPRVPIFTIVKELENEDGTPKMVEEPGWEADPEVLGEQSAPLVRATENIEYSMPATPNAGLALKYLKMARTQSAEVALGWIFELAIGSEAYDALSDETDLDPDVLAALMFTVQQRALGGLDAPKGS